MIEQTATPAAEPEVDDARERAIVEATGHRRQIGRCREMERYGIKMVLVDAPRKGDPEAHGWTTHFSTGSSLFGVPLRTVRSADRASGIRMNSEDRR